MTYLVVASGVGLWIFVAGTITVLIALTTSASARLQAFAYGVLFFGLYVTSLSHCFIFTAPKSNRNSLSSGHSPKTSPSSLKAEPHTDIVPLSSVNSV